jgi:predicted dinucleotide-binding enzyme
MRVGIIGAGHIGGGIARQAIRAGHEVMISFSRDPEDLDARASELGTTAGRVADAVQFGDLCVLSVPWDAIEEALAQAGSLQGSIIVDTTNQFGRAVQPPQGQTAAAFNAARMPGARYTKCFNTLTARFQEIAWLREPRERVVQWIAGDDPGANETVSDFVKSLGFVPVVLGGVADCAVMEAPRREGAVYGEEYRASDAMAVVEAVQAGRPIPHAPHYP